MTRPSRPLLLALEFAAVFGGGPALVLWLRRPGILFALLWAGALAAYALTRHIQPEPHEPRRELAAIARRFAILAPIMTVLAWWLWPATFLILPRRNPGFWALIMLLYPLLSVWPQEMLYRALIFARYQPLFRTRIATVIASGAVFGLAHIIFLNAIAVAMTAIGGTMFARDYARHRSLALACLEHSLYGCLVFTLGLGRFFYTGAAWHQA